MAQSVAQLKIDLVAETARFRADMGKATKAMNTNMGKMKRSVNGMKRSMDGLNKVVGIISKAFLALAVVMGAGSILKAADKYNVLQERIKTATKATNDYKQVSSELSTIAKRTGANLKDSVDVFQRLSLGAKDLGKSNTDVLKLVESVQQLGVVSGASQTAMSAGLLQFGQAMSAGTVRAEEMNSIVENLPALAQKIADGFGISTGQLQKMVREGTVLSEDVFNILLEQSGDIKKEFEAMPVSLERAVSGLKLTMTEYLAMIDKSVGVTSGLAKAIQGASMFFDKHKETIERVIGVSLKLFSATTELWGAFLKLVVAINPLTPLLVKMFDKMGGGTGVLEKTINFINWLADAFTKLAKKINNAASAIGKFWGHQMGKITKGFGQVKRMFQNIGNFSSNNDFQLTVGVSTQSTYKDLVEQAKTANNQTAQSTNKMVDQVERAVEGMGYSFQNAFTQMAQTGKLEMNGMVNSILNDLARLASSSATSFLSGAISKFAGSLFGGGGGGIGSSLGLPTKGLTFAANGADARSNQPFMVGEEGPELFMPRGAGSIIPHGQSMNMMNGGSGAVVNIYNNYALGVQSTVKAEIARYTPELLKQAKNAVIQASTRGRGMSTAMGRRS